MARVLIAGCGYVGRPAGRASSGRMGHEVWGLRRERLAPAQSGIGRWPATSPGPETLGTPCRWGSTTSSTRSARARCGTRRRTAPPTSTASAACSTPSASRGASAPHLLHLEHRGLRPAARRVGGRGVGDGLIRADFRGQIDAVRPSDCCSPVPFPSHGGAPGRGIYGPGRDRMIEAVRRAASASRLGWSPTTRTASTATTRPARLATPDGRWTIPEIDEVYLGVDQRAGRPRRSVLRWLAEHARCARARWRSTRRAPRGRRAGSKRCRNDRCCSSTGYHFDYPTFREGYCSASGESRRDQQSGSAMPRLPRLLLAAFATMPGAVYSPFADRMARPQRAPLSVARGRHLDGALRGRAHAGSSRWASTRACIATATPGEFPSSSTPWWRRSRCAQRAALRARVDPGRRGRYGRAGLRRGERSSSRARRC